MLMIEGPAASAMGDAYRIEADYLRNTLDNSDDTKGHTEEFKAAKVTLELLLIPQLSEELLVSQDGSICSLMFSDRAARIRRRDWRTMTHCTEFQSIS